MVVCRSYFCCTTELKSSYRNIVVSYVVWLMATRTAKLLPHLWSRPQDIIHVPAFILFGYYFAVMKLYALVTLHEVSFLACCVVAWLTIFYRLVGVRALVSVMRLLPLQPWMRRIAVFLMKKQWTTTRTPNKPRTVVVVASNMRKLHKRHPSMTFLRLISITTMPPRPRQVRRLCTTHISRATTRAAGTSMMIIWRCRSGMRAERPNLDPGLCLLFVYFFHDTDTFCKGKWTTMLERTFAQIIFILPTVIDSLILSQVCRTTLSSNSQSFTLGVMNKRRNAVEGSGRWWNDIDQNRGLYLAQEILAPRL